MSVALSALFSPDAWAVLFAACPALAPAFAAVLGAIAMSFGGVVVDRLPHSLGWRDDADPTITLAAPPSRCDGCGAKVGWLGLIPVLGWLVLKGRCRSCGAKVPWCYPAMETLGAVLSVAFILRYGPTPLGFAGAAAVPVLLVLGWMDQAQTWVPDRIVFPFLVLGLVASPFVDAQARVDGLALAAGLMWGMMALVGRAKGLEAVMGGDIVLAAAAGAWMGPDAVPLWLLASSLPYIAYSAPRTARGDVWAPFGPFLCAAMIACLMLGEASHIQSIAAVLF